MRMSVTVPSGNPSERVRSSRRAARSRRPCRVGRCGRGRCRRGPRRSPRRSRGRGPCRAGRAASSARVKRSNARGRNSVREARALVVDVQLDGAVRCLGAQRHGPVAVRERVVDQVRERLLEPRGVGAQRHARRGVGLQRPPLGPRARLEAAGDALEQLAGLQLLGADRAAGLGPSGRSRAGPRRAATAARSPRRPSAARPRAPRACARRAARARAPCAGSRAACAARARRRRRTPARA